MRRLLPTLLAPFLTACSAARIPQEAAFAAPLGGASLGVETETPSAEVAEAMALETRVRVEGRRVRSAEPGGAAARAGIAPGDVLLRIGGNALFSQDDLDDFLAIAASPGEQVEVVLKRPGRAEPRTVPVTLGRRPERKGLRDGIAWQYASLEQLPAALEEARSKKKRILAGLSGAET